MRFGGKPLEGCPEVHLLCIPELCCEIHLYSSIADVARLCCASRSLECSTRKALFSALARASTLLDLGVRQRALRTLAGIARTAEVGAIVPLSLKREDLSAFVSAVIGQLADESDEICATAIAVLAASAPTDDLEIVGALFGALRMRCCEHVRKMALLALGTLVQAERGTVFKVAVETLRDQHNDVCLRAAAMRVMLATSARGDASATAVLMELLETDDLDPNLRRLAMCILTKVVAPGNVEAFKLIASQAFQHEEDITGFDLCEFLPAHTPTLFLATAAAGGDRAALDALSALVEGQEPSPGIVRALAKVSDGEDGRARVVTVPLLTHIVRRCHNSTSLGAEILALAALHRNGNRAVRDAATRLLWRKAAIIDTRADQVLCAETAVCGSLPVSDLRCCTGIGGSLCLIL